MDYSFYFIIDYMYSTYDCVCIQYIKYTVKNILHFKKSLHLLLKLYVFKTTINCCSKLLFFASVLSTINF